MFLLDTNVLSELRRRDKAHRNVVAWANASPAANFFLSAISILEIELGARLIERKDPAQGAVLRSWIDNQILTRFEGRILAIDTAVAQRCAQLHVPNPRAERDALIAATALVHGLTIITRNVADFEPTGVPLLNPWDDT
ncbi:type II toxin-antitoxin system VapC family toxin [Bradyrhizobium sp. CCGB12]|uniref:type II toxin-antitoxin system VapC family toxin n=1 Tax=Bradyrhizobium sp. CCGB12 TaxID=2949632 RepID=UPI0020B1B5C9|nr:type II toxin-antitoxin system VapC family toxin [Bradyrhizobium sp. CCGB12]MCP3391680.1 type II toxin-antitoxin system VapC family toxin [Bradyrhizobium sp. CCGB12]